MNPANDREPRRNAPAMAIPRYGRPEDIAAMCVVAGPEGRFITGRLGRGRRREHVSRSSPSSRAEA